MQKMRYLRGFFSQYYINSTNAIIYQWKNIRNKNKFKFKYNGTIRQIGGCIEHN